ncbi:MAG: MATE family efflux transporter [Clostridia bacterium]|nr:MATE family efflux transporter [Clostridia bacterium]
MSRTIDMTVGSPTKHILKFAFPLIATNLGQQLYTIVDAAIVGRGVGVKALAAVGSADWCCWLILWTVSTLTQGFSTFVSRYFGDKNYKAMNKVIAMSTLLSIVIGIFLTVGGLVAAKPILLLLKTPEDIFDGANTYLTTIIAGTLIVTAYNLTASILRAFGDGRSPLIAMLIAALLNIGLDMIFVFVFDMGIFGAALASVIAQLVSFLYCLFKISKIEYIKLERDMFRPDFRLIKDLLAFGLPLALETIVISLGGIILQSSINAQGSIFIAGYTATNKVYGLLESSAIALGLSCSTFLAQNYGAGNFARVKKGVKTSLVIVLLMSVAVTVLTLLGRKWLLLLFLDITEQGGPEALEIAIHYITILAFCLSILYLLHIFRNALQAMEISIWSMISGLLEFAARVIMSKVVIHYIGTDALFISEPVAWFGALVSVMLPYLYYRKKLLNEKSQKAE